MTVAEKEVIRKYVKDVSPDHHFGFVKWMISVLKAK